MVKTHFVQMHMHSTGERERSRESEREMHSQPSDERERERGRERERHNVGNCPLAHKRLLLIARNTGNTCTIQLHHTYVHAPSIPTAYRCTIKFESVTDVVKV